MLGTRHPLWRYTLCAQGPIDDRFAECITSLSEKIKFCTGQKSPKRAPALASPTIAAMGGSLDDVLTLEDLGILPAETLAGRDTLPQLEQLRVKASVRVRVAALVCYAILTHAVDRWLCGRA
jgi:hypothetical protein